MHCLIVGNTMSGKTTLSKKLIQFYKSRGIKTIVYDPMNDPDFGADFVTDNEQEFLYVFWNNTQCMVFVDEAGQTVGRYNSKMIETATQGRHMGHKCHFITQRATQIAPTVRGQCSHLFLFQTSRKDCIEHAEDWNNDELKDGFTLENGVYYHCTRQWGKVKKMRVF